MSFPWPLVETKALNKNQNSPYLSILPKVMFSLFLLLAYPDGKVKKNLVAYVNQPWEDRKGEKESCVGLTELIQSVRRNVG